MGDEFLTIGGLRIRYRRAGAGTPVLILHGWGASIEAVQILFEELSRTHDAVAIDFPGHGQSGEPASPWTVSDFARLTLDVLDQLGIARPSVVAHSFGGRVAIKLAAGHPERVGRILLTGAAGVPPQRTLGQRVRLALASAGKRVRKLVGDGALPKWMESRWVYYVASADYARASGVMRKTLVQVVAEDLTPLLPRVAAKCLLIWGDQDRDAPLSSGRVMARLIPDNELVILEGAGHFAYADQFSKFRLHMQRFLRDA